MFKRKMKQSYETVFKNPNADLCVGDLSRFCNATTTCFRKDPLESARMEGRREVWLRIQDMLSMDIKDVIERQNKMVEIKMNEENYYE